jgi:glycosyltransferase 2 family protein
VIKPSFENEYELKRARRSSTMKKKTVLLLMRLLISFGLIGYFLIAFSQKHGGFGEALDKFGSAFSGASLDYLLPAFLLHLVGFSLASFRWKILLRAQGIRSRYGNLFSYYFMAAFFNTLLPSTIGGDALRAVESKRLTGNATTSVMVVLVERLTGLMALIIISVSALSVKLFWRSNQKETVWVFLLAAVVGMVLLIALVHPRIAIPILRLLKKMLPEKLYRLVENAHEAVSVYYRRPGALLASLGISIIFQLNMVLYYYLLASALHQKTDPLDFMVKVPIMVFLLMVVPTINGLGIRTAGFKELMKFPEAYAFAVEFIDLGFRILYGMLGGLMFLFYRRSRQAAENERKGTTGEGVTL